MNNAKSLGLSENEIDQIITGGMYKAGSFYGTTSINDVYKSGMYYGTISIDDL